MPGHDPQRDAALQELLAQDSQRAGPPQGVPQGDPAAAGQEGGNEVARHLANASEALLRTGPTPENQAAIVQFMTFLEGIGKELDAQSGAGQPIPPSGQVAPPQAPAGPPLPQAAPTGPLPAPGGLPLG